MRIKVSAIIALGLLSGCGEEALPTDEELIDYSQLEVTQPSKEALVLADGPALDRHIKNGLRLSIGSAGSDWGGSTGSSGFWSSSSSSGGGFASSSSSGSGSSGGGSNSSSGMLPDSNSPNEGGGSESPDGGSPYSDTNVHVAGVDESDFAKYDGRHWFIATSQVRTADYTISGGPGFQIVAPDADGASAEILGSFRLDDPWGDINQMYLVNDVGSTSHVVLLQEQRGNVRPDFPSWSNLNGLGVQDGSSYYEPNNGKVRLQLINVENPLTPVSDLDIQLDGTLIDSRKIGDVIYLVTRFEPWIEGLGMDYGDTTIRKENEEILKGRPLTALLPHYQMGDVTRQPLTADCYVQEGLNDYTGYASLVHITAIDVRQQALLASRCVNASVTSISMSLQSLYLTGTVAAEMNWRGDGDTVIHKFSLDDEVGLHYVATGSVTGSIQGNSDPAFRLHEFEDDLRIVTTRWEGGPLHQLFVLRQMGNELAEISSLPNSRHPEPVGKPNEDIFSVRFEDDRAFIVTFERVDPLYMIDLSDPLDPRVAGELEIPGFATYMHPLNSRYLFTLGRDVDENGRQAGIKAELIDVSGDDPVSVNSVIMGGDFNYSYSEALQNLRAMNLLKVDDSKWHIAFPFQYTNSFYDEVDGTYRETYLNGLQLLEINGLDNDEAALTNAGIIQAEQGESDAYYPSFVSRGLLQGTAAFFAHKNAIWAASWGTPDEAIGPIKAAPGACTPTVYNGIEVDLRLESLEPRNACDATVTISDGAYRETLVPQQVDNSEENCIFAGAVGRAGGYLLSAELPGFVPANNYVIVWRDECHIQTEKKRVTLYDCKFYEEPPLWVTVTSGEALRCEGSVNVIKDGESYPLNFDGGGGGFAGSPGSIGSSGSSGAWSSGSSSSSSSSSSSAASSSSGGSLRNTCYYSGGTGLTGEVSLEVSLNGHAPYLEEGIILTSDACPIDQSESRHIYLEPLTND